jgi:phosphoenolpyruvate-protein kinase (PTS system EI component)
MAADRISMSPSSIPAAKQFIRAICYQDARNALNSVLEMEDVETINDFLTDYIQKTLPAKAAN